MKGLSLTPKRKEQLENQLKQTRDVRVYRRTLAVLESGSGTPVSQIAHMLKVDRRSIDRWIEAYGQAYDPLSLWDEQRSGRPPRWTEECFAWLQALLEASPQEFDFFATSWTVPLLQEQLEQCLGERFSDETLRRALRQLGYVWKRGRYVLEPDPEREKKRRIRRKIRQLGPRSVLLAEDETDLLLFPPLRAGWGRRGEAMPVVLSGRNARRVVFGAMNLRTGTRLFLARRRQRQEDFQEFLRLVRWHYRGWHVALLLDEDSSHTAGQSRQLAEQFRMTLLWLPKRSPELNPMDHLWGQGKDVVSANKQRETIDDHVDQFLQYLQSLSPSEALNTAGVFSEDFWLKSVL